mmetsp:Transcript_250/g.304  ORF Transcript_250/g.304 Transcript_250/m.304 type:complete len:107 (+) Transcript_250:93-413(+)|eukprot:CAMPEP_0119042784 /NCGR_PEP_ID=MMETSP1177-20130426/16154_1 /TAXON_ID=2985 /ORGANISM="Ochromonas sp, Strain CCMP1899" /LENGTH=106 /DNA_ID=CAMNT_0007009793 /DNA_START=74 /DNA_END=394 /DNA_ORIENTATION=-
MSSFGGRGGGGGGGAPRVRKVMTQAINLIFEFLKNKERVQMWLYENTAMKMEGVIIGFDEYMNIVLDAAQEVNTKTGAKREVGKILLKGDCITLMQRAVQLEEEEQ